MAPNIQCRNCGSRNIVPIAVGDPDPKMLILSAQGRIALSGCLVCGPGTALWSCADCDTDVIDNHLVNQSVETFAMREHRRELDKLFLECASIGFDELYYLQAQRWIETLIKRYFLEGEVEIKLSWVIDGFRMQSGKNDEVVSLSGPSRFEHMQKYVEDNSSEGECPFMILQVRVGREEREFRVSCEFTKEAEKPTILIVPI